MMNKIIFFILICLEILLPASYLFAGDDVDKYIDTMTLRQQIGQLIMIGIQEKTLKKHDVMHLKKINPGGIVFYGRNLHDASDILPLIEKIQKILDYRRLPVFFAIDQEGGIVHRIEGELYKPPSAVTIGATGSEALAREVGLSVGSILRRLGININLAPVLDIPSDIISAPITPRCFSNNPKSVERLGVAYINGLKEAGILSAAKHFPGIGRALEDSHNTLPRIRWKNTEERESDLMPFKGAIRSGADLIMVGHITGEPGDSKNPVSLSSYWMRDILRKEFGFDGLIIVDNIEMKPIKDMMPIPMAAVESFKAGADIIMVSHERENQQAVFQALLDAVKRSEISQERLKESLRRIIKVKKKLMSRGTNNTAAKNLMDISKIVAENSVIGIKLKETPYFSVSKADTVLYAGNNLILFNAVRNIFKYAEILNTTLVNFEKIQPSLPLEGFMKKFDALIIDTDYSDAKELISLCNNLNIPYFALQNRPSDTRKILERLKPRYMIIVFETNRIYLELASEIINGEKQTKGRLPYDLPMPSAYIYMTK